MWSFFMFVRLGIAGFLLFLAAVILRLLVVDGGDWRMMVATGTPFAIIGVLMVLGVLRDRKAAAQKDADYREVAVLRLADAKGGTLTATQVASRLGWPMETALAALRAAEDAGPVTSTVSPDGVLVFEFRELMLDLARLRALADAEAPVAEPAEGRAG